MNSQIEQDDTIIKKMHEHYLDRWLKLYDFDEYKQWLFRGLLKLLRKYTKKGTVLEIGCSKGYFTNMLSHNGYHAIGSDISLTALRTAAKIERTRLDAEILPFKNDTFDAVLAVYTIEHIPKPSKCLDEIFRVLKPKKPFIAVTPDKESVLTKVGFHLVRYTSLKNPYHVGLMSRKELKKSMETSGFSDFVLLPFHNGFLGAPLLKRFLRKEFIPIPLSTNVLFPFSHHQLIMALK
jgi:SAM-dependent methyltransferase